MLVVMDVSATPEQIEQVVNVIEAKGCTARPIPGGDRVSIGVLNNAGPWTHPCLLGCPGSRTRCRSPSRTSWSAGRPRRTTP
ncbi:hypothetical protein [Desulfosarcina cetonica]|uniref:hypothetical protein n=1 Tax=Desulfosarcina cetonica TaxID=90730 RepID=UPI001FEF199B|nr:hypothetical protein [Desulfosarcina cetonica]